MKPPILIVDDRNETMPMLETILGSQYEITTVGSGKAALEYLAAADELPELILLDVLMPNLNGFGVLTALKKSRRFRDIPAIFITTGHTEKQALALGADDCIPAPLDAQVVRMRVRHQLLLKTHMDDLEHLAAEKIQEATSTRDNTLMVLADIIEYRSIESGSHVKRVAKYAEAVLEDLLEDSEYAAQLREIGPDVIVKSVPLHDVGKIGIPDSILLKPGPLNPLEFETMKTHTTLGKTIVESILHTSHEESDFLRHCADIAYSHHEWYDGSGYPEGRKGDEIPLSARVMAVVDVYDALVTKRVYKDAFPHDEAIRTIREESGTHFDPVIVRALLRTQDRCHKIARKNAEPAPIKVAACAILNVQ